MGFPKTSLHGLYAITDATLQRPEELHQQVLLAVEGGARLVQYRDKSSDTRFRLRQARALADTCHSHGTALIINDDCELAAECGADGVHLGRDDAAPGTARKLLGDDAIIGISCYNNLDLAAQAADQGADYLAFGRFFPSLTKPAAVQADVNLIRQSKQRWPLPVAAIGGITSHNALPLIAAGVDMLAVVQGVFAAADVRKAASEFAALFQTAAACNPSGDSLPTDAHQLYNHTN